MSGLADLRAKVRRLEEEVDAFCENYRGLSRFAMDGLTMQREEEIRKIDQLSLDINKAFMDARKTYEDMLQGHFALWADNLLKELCELEQEYREIHMAFYCASRESGI